MSPLSRREFGRTVIAGIPLAAAIGSIRIVGAAPVTIGVSTDSFRDLPRATGRDNLDDIIRALQGARVSHVELAMSNIEPAPPSTAPFMGGSPAYPQRIVFTPEQILAMNAAARYELRSWRLRTGPGHFDDARHKLAAANLTVHACALAVDDVFSDAEIDAVFRQIQTLGVGIVSAPMTMKTAARIAPFAERHGVAVAIHNDVDGNSAGAIATKEIEAALALSPAFKLKVDVGNVTASNGDPVAVLRRNQPRVSHVLLKDRLRNAGTSQHFGEGDTPIAAVMDLLKTWSPAVPAFVEYDYPGLHAPADEVSAALAYVARLS